MRVGKEGWMTDDRSWKFKPQPLETSSRQAFPKEKGDANCNLSKAFHLHYPYATLSADGKFGGAYLIHKPPIFR